MPENDGADTVPRRTRIVIAAVFAAIAAAAVMMAALHAGPLRVAWAHTVSEYVHGTRGWMFTAAVAALALGSATLLVEMIRLRAHSRSVWLMTGMWVGGLALVAVFPIDADERTITGVVHNYSSLAATVGLLGAGLILGFRFRRRPRSRRLAATTRRCALIGAATLVVFVLTFIGSATPGLPPSLHWLQRLVPGPNPVGMAERLLVIVEIAVLVQLARWLTVDDQSLRRVRMAYGPSRRHAA